MRVCIFAMKALLCFAKEFCIGHQRATLILCEVAELRLVPPSRAAIHRSQHFQVSASRYVQSSKIYLHTEKELPPYVTIKELPVHLHKSLQFLRTAPSL
jgi:hypothetical protein